MCCRTGCHILVVRRNSPSFSFSPSFRRHSFNPSFRIHSRFEADRTCCCCCLITEEDLSCKNADDGHEFDEFKRFSPLFLHDEEFCKIFKELNAVDGAFCLSVSKRGFVLLFLLLLLEEKPPFISSKSPSSSNSSSLNASSSDRGRL